MNDSQTIQPRLVSYAAACAYLSISRRSLERLVARQAIRSIRLGRRRLIKSEDLDRFVAQAKG